MRCTKVSLNSYEIQEANNAFALNRDVFYELEGAVKAAIGDHVFDRLIRQDIPGVTERVDGALRQGWRSQLDDEAINCKIYCDETISCRCIRATLQSRA